VTGKESPWKHSLLVRLSPTDGHLLSGVQIGEHRFLASVLAKQMFRFAPDLRESHQLHFWYPVDPATGEADYNLDLSGLGPLDVDEKSFSDCYCYCRICSDTFFELVEIATTSETNRSE
jgi:hypothetical protein